MSSISASNTNRPGFLGGLRRIWSGSSFRRWLLLLVIPLTIGLIGGVAVLLNGLGITNLSNEVPWGLWITVDLSAIAVGAGGFSLSAIAYILRVKSYQQIARAAVFVGLTGYTAAMLALVMDIGRPDRFWHPIIFWNIHSVLWEVTMCVILYSSVLLVEFGPIVLESEFVRKRFPRGPQIGHAIHRLTPLMAVLGLALSLLHQSSLGATYGVLVARPVWFKPSMPIMFILSAVGVGASFTLALTLVYENLIRRRQIAVTLRNSVATFAGLTLLAYLYLKLWDFLATSYYSHLPARIEAQDLLNRATPYGGSFWLLEVVLGALVPAIILLTPRFRRNDLLVIVGVGFAVLGVIVNRWNVTLSGLIVPLDWSPGVAEIFSVNAYQPALVEWAVAVGVLGYALLVFSLGLRYLPMYPKEEHAH